MHYFSMQKCSHIYTFTKLLFLYEIPVIPLSLTEVLLSLLTHVVPDLQRKAWPYPQTNVLSPLSLSHLSLLYYCDIYHGLCHYRKLHLYYYQIKSSWGKDEYKIFLY